MSVTNKMQLSRKVKSHETAISFTGGIGSKSMLSPSHVLFPTRKSIGASGNKNKTTLTNLRNAFRVHLDGNDVTPKALQHPTYHLKIDNSMEEDTGSEKNTPERASVKSGKMFKSQSISTFKTQLQLLTRENENNSFSSFQVTNTMHDVTTVRSFKLQCDESRTLTEASDQAPSEFNLPRVFIDECLPPRMNIVLKETDIITFFEAPSKVEDRNTPLGAQVLKDNAEYEYLTIGKGRNRKVVNAETQTNNSLTKSRSTQAEKSKRKNAASFASEWDMHDTFKKLNEEEANRLKPFQTQDDILNIKNVTFSKLLINFNEKNKFEEQCIQLFQNETFQDAVSVIERILASNIYKIEHLRIRGTIKQDPFRPNIEYKYNLEHLWTFKSDNTFERSVMKIAWNPLNSDILAVGYGKFNYGEVKSGVVCCWNIKNPSQPERTYLFNVAVTGVSFSSVFPNLLAVGFYDGTVQVLDVSVQKLKVIAQSSRETSASHEPIWDVTWIFGTDYYQNSQFVCTTGEDGRVNAYLFTKTIQMNCIELIRITRVEGVTRGIPNLNYFATTGVPLVKYPAALCISINPYDTALFYVGTTEGCIHVCSKHYINQHIRLFVAHNGPVYAIKFSPFCTKVFLTCGADWAVRIWIESIREPLITLTSVMQPIVDIEWHPGNSTIIVGICGTEIYLWDIQRKTYVPANIITIPTNIKLTRVKFSESGRNLLIGDVEGNVFVFSLEDMPHTPFFSS